jgi:hypothetical protein
MQADELNDKQNAVVDRINAGEEIASVEPALIEHLWTALNSIPREQLEKLRGSTGSFGVHCDPDLLPESPEKRVGMMMRNVLFNALLERGILDEYMKDEVLRKKVFAAAALFPCDKDDLGEAVAQRLIRDAQPDVAEKTREEFRQAGYDPDHPKVAAKFIAWIRENC